MFGIFTRKSNKAEVIIAEPVKHAPVPNLATMLILAMTSYIEQNERIAGELVPVIPDVRKAYQRLLKLGMGQTQNAKALQAQVEANDRANADNIKAKNLIAFVKAAQEHFGPRTVLVSFTAFEDLCNRYGLVRGLLSDYCGVIPERNVQDIENVLTKIGTFTHKSELNNTRKVFLDDCGSIMHVTSVNVNRNHPDLPSFIKRNHNLVELVEPKSTFCTQVYPIQIAGYDYGIYGYLSEINGKILDHKDMLIACPTKYLKNPELKVTSKPVDPAVFQYTPYGVLVHTIWGEEAEDAAFKEFMELNLRIAKS